MKSPSVSNDFDDNMSETLTSSAKLLNELSLFGVANENSSSLFYCPLRANVIINRRVFEVSSQHPIRSSVTTKVTNGEAGLQEVMLQSVHELQ